MGTYAIADPVGRIQGAATTARDEGEAALVERARRDPQAFALLYRRHYQAVVGYIFRRTGDLHASEDLAAETFIAAYRAMPRYRVTGAPFVHWLLRIATNRTTNWSKRRRRHAALPRQEEAPSIPADGRDGESGSRVEPDALLRAVARLPDAQQSAIALHYFEGLTLEQVAGVLRCRVGTVKSRLARARLALRSMLEPGAES